MGVSLEVNSSNFAVEVLEQSYAKPVLVDFFAQWCGPCQMLKPTLERLVKEYDFVLAKVDIDHNPDLAHTYGVEGVPDVRIVAQGEVKPGFVGVLPEGKLRELLAQFNLQSELEVGLAEIRAATDAENWNQAKQLFSQLIEKYPDNRPLAIAAAKFLIRQDRLESAETLLASIQEQEKEYFTQARGLRGLIQFKQEQNAATSELDELYARAIHLTLAEDYEPALQLFLEILQRDRKYKNDGARKAMITVFEILGDDHPLTKDYRKQLLMALY